MKTKAIVVSVVILLWAATTGLALQKGKQREDPNVRSVQGVVVDQGDSPVEGAVVKLKNTKSLQVRSFITQSDGTYYFHGLSTNIDYELKADRGGASSEAKTLSVFDSRKKAIINLKLESK
jgi:hypothetical protein